MFCENCGNQIPDNSLNCPRCGAPAPQDETVGFLNCGGQGLNSSNQKEPVFTKWWFWLLTVLLAAAIAVAVFLALRLADQKNQEKSDTGMSALGETDDESGSGTVGNPDGKSELSGGKTDTESGKVAKITPKDTQNKLGADGNGKDESGSATNPIEVAPEESSSGTGSTIVVPSSGSTETLSEDYIFPDSNTCYLSESEVKEKSKEELRIARNEIFARHGRLFNDAELQAYFNSKSWYKGTISAGAFNTNVFNDYEKKNLELIQKIEDQKK